MVALAIAMVATRQVSALNPCRPPWDGDWSLTSSCMWIYTAKVYGNINIGGHTIYMTPNTILAFDPGTTKISSS